MIVIAPYISQQKEQVQRVCYDTTTPFFKDKKPLLFLLYCDYYIEEDAITLVAKQQDEVVGYVMAAKADSFLKNFKAKYLPKIKALSWRGYLEAKSNINVVKKYAKKYDYHLHIDILEQYQRQGIGHLLIDELVKKLKDIDAKGVFLVVNSSNKKGVGFYEKYGFDCIKSNKFCITYGIRF